VAGLVNLMFCFNFHADGGEGGGTSPSFALQWKGKGGNLNDQSSDPARRRGRLAMEKELLFPKREKRDMFLVKEPIAPRRTVNKKGKKGRVLRGDGWIVGFPEGFKLALTASSPRKKEEARWDLWLRRPSFLRPAERKGGGRSRSLLPRFPYLYCR